MAAIHTALMAGVVLFLALVIGLVFLNNNTGLYDKAVGNGDLELIFYIIVYGAALATFAFGIIVFERNMKHAKSFPFMKDKISVFRSAYMIRLALAEGPAFLSIIIYMLTGNYYYLPAAALCIGSLYMARPTQDFVAYALYLSDKEKVQLADY